MTAHFASLPKVSTTETDRMTAVNGSAKRSMNKGRVCGCKEGRGKHKGKGTTELGTEV